MGDEVLIKVEHLSKKFCRSFKRSLQYGLQDIATEISGGKGNRGLRPQEFWAVKDVSFEIRRGECLGLIGPNGAGKSTLLKLLNGLIKPDVGKITVRGRLRALIELGAGFNPVLTGLENIYNQASVHGMDKGEVDRKLDAILDFADIGEFIHTPVRNYSSGMKVRLGFAIAAQMEPDVLILDEVLAVGDVGFRAKCYSAISETMKRAAVIFVSHAMGHVSRLASRTLVLNKGKNYFIGATNLAIIEYQKLCGTAGKDAIQEKLFDTKGLGFERVGSGEIRITSVKLIDQYGQENNEFQYGSFLRVVLDVEAKVNIDSLVVDLGFYTMSNEVVAECNNFVLPRHISVEKQQKMTIEVLIKELTLNPGAYKMSALLLSDNMTAHYDWMKHFTSIKVTGARVAIANQQFKADWKLIQ